MLRIEVVKLKWFIQFIELIQYWRKQKQRKIQFKLINKVVNNLNSFFFETLELLGFSYFPSPAPFPLQDDIRV